jgi:hypothetical protein
LKSRQRSTALEFRRGLYEQPGSAGSRTHHGGRHSLQSGEWEDTDFLKDSEEKGVTIDLKGSDTKTIELKLIQPKNMATSE